MELEGKPAGTMVTEEEFAAMERRSMGLGDLVAAVAKPIARAIDAVAGTDLEHCQGCAKRQAWLNALGQHE